MSMSCDRTIVSAMITKAIYSELSSDSIVAHMQCVFEIAGRTNNRLVAAADRTSVRTVLFLCTRKLGIHVCCCYNSQTSS